MTSAVPLPPTAAYTGTTPEYAAVGVRANHEQATGRPAPVLP
ncbi:hypothetical protein ACIREO_36835 [Streptomyces sp. NPDC102441]